jgi:hypothetical protein
MSLVKDVWDLVWLNVVRSVAIITGILLVPKTFLNVLSIIIFINTVIDILFINELDIKVWFKKQITTIVLMTTLYGLYKLAGVVGTIALALLSIVILLFFAGMSIYQNWNIYDAVTTWGAKRILGKTKKEFNLKRVMKK